jgi:hypothetical protein
MNGTARGILAAISVAFTLGTGAADTLAAESGPWAYFKLRPGQFFKYKQKGERALSGWFTIDVKAGDKNDLKVTIAGKWTSDYSETVTLKPGKTGFDLATSFKDVNITNAVSALLDVDAPIVEHLTLQDGFKWTQGDKTLTVHGDKEVAGVNGKLVTYSFQVFGRTTTKTLAINPDMPLPIYAEVPAANDKWTYTLVEKK